MAAGVGKKFEQKFKEDFLKIENATIDRLYDTTNGFKSITQISDYIGYIYPNIYYIELKTHAGNTFPFTNLTQYDKLTTKMGIKGVRVGVVIWFYDHDRIVYVPLASIKQMKEDGKKSVNVKMIDEGKYFMIEFPGKKKKVFFDTDYTKITSLEEGQ